MNKDDPSGIPEGFFVEVMLCSERKKMLRIHKFSVQENRTLCKKTGLKINRGVMYI